MLMRSIFASSKWPVTQRLVAQTACRGFVASSPRALESSKTVLPTKDQFNIKTDPGMLKTGFRERLAAEREAALLGGGQARIDKIHKRGSLT